MIETYSWYNGLAECTRENGEAFTLSQPLRLEKDYAVLRLDRIGIKDARAELNQPDPYQEQ